MPLSARRNGLRTVLVAAGTAVMLAAMTAAADDGVQLTAEAKVTDGALRVRYTLANRSGRDIYVLNVLWDHAPGGAPVRDRHAAYVSLPFDGKADLLVGVLPEPKRKLVELRMIPYATRLAAGADLAQELVLTLPVEEYNWYYPADSGNRYGQARAQGIRLTLHYLPDSPQLEQRAGPWPDTWFVRHPRLFEALTSAQATADTPAFDARPRVDAFERF